MRYCSRRSFLQQTIAAASAAGLLRGNPLGLPLGCQTYPVRKQIARDFPGTLATLSAAGFERVELCSPVGYADSGFGGLAKYKAAELKRILSDHNLGCESSHFSMEELRGKLDERIEWATELGLTQMMVPSLEGPKHPTADDVKRAAEEYNRIAERTAKAGMIQGLHNEGFEESTVDGKRTYDMLFELLDPNLVKFQFQCSTIAEGFDAAEYLGRYPRRFISMHVQDWSPKEHKVVAVGKGVLDWKKIFGAAREAEIKNYFVEMDLPLMEASVPYLKSLSA